MSPQSPRPRRRRPRPGARRAAGPPAGCEPVPRWAIWVLAGALVAEFLLPSLLPSDRGDDIAYSDLRARWPRTRSRASPGRTTSGSITGTFNNGTEFSSNGPIEPSEADLALFRENDVEVKFDKPAAVDLRDAAHPAAHP